MLESAEVGNTIPKAQYQEERDALRVDLLNAQFDLQQADFSVVLLIMGDDRLGCRAVLQVMHEWMDGRYILTNVFGGRSDEERERPRFWRYWRVLPPKGRIGTFVGAWALRACANRINGGIDDAGFEHRIDQIRQFEEDLASDGAIVLKLWIHMPKKELQKRLKRAKKNPESDWRVEDTDWQWAEIYDESIPIAERYLRRTSTGSCPWHLIEGTDARYRNLTAMRLVRDAIAHRLVAETAPVPSPRPQVLAASAGTGLLRAVDVTATLPRPEYREALERQQARVARLTRTAAQKGVSCVLAFEGWDAAGKGGCIRRITHAMDVENFRVVPVSAPTDEEKARHYLWRFWRQLPRAGQVLIFDRSWYGRVLVERVEGFARDDEWRRAYAEINDFEEQLVERGILVQKFWLHIDQEEQMRRFEIREQTAYKKHKITEEDYRNRERWDEYVAAVDEMVARTSTEIAPWTLVAANDKRWARVKVIETFADGLEKRLEKADGKKKKS